MLFSVLLRYQACTHAKTQTCFIEVSYKRKEWREEDYSNFHYLMRFGTQEILGVLEVKGDATEASSSDKEMPPCALFKA